MDDDDDGILLDGSDCGEPAVGADGAPVAATGYLATGVPFDPPYTDADGVFHDPILEAEHAYRYGLPGPMTYRKIIFDEQSYTDD